jgi:hypothetical protein
VRVYKAAGDYSLITVLDWPHTRWINCVALFGDDHIVSTSVDRTLCVTLLSSSTVVARTELRYAVNCSAALPEGCLTVCGLSGNASRIDSPAAAIIFKAHGAAAFPEAAAAASPPAVAEPLRPLQYAVVRASTGSLTAATACHDLTSATPVLCCSRSDGLGTSFR